MCDCAEIVCFDDLQKVVMKFSDDWPLISNVIKVCYAITS